MEEQDGVLGLFSQISTAFIYKFKDGDLAYIFLLPIILVALLIATAIFFYIVNRRKDKKLLHEILATTPEPDESELPKTVKAQELVEYFDATQTLDDNRVHAAEESWLKRLSTGLGKTRSQMLGSLATLFSGQVKLDEATLEKIHENLYRADLGISTVDRLVKNLRKNISVDQSADFITIKKELKSQIEGIFAEVDLPENDPVTPPKVILIVGVNGVGKTTTIGKLAANFVKDNMSVLLCAADTYRAAAIDQLKIWGERVGVQVIAHQQGSDPAAVAFDSVKAAKSRNSDILLIDTAGRLHNKQELMEELAKIKRVIAKELPSAPHEVWLVLDATTGQNAFIQTKAFSDVVQLTGIIMTKLDGTAKGGVAVGIVNQFKLPIRYIGIGEGVNDLQQFNANDFTNSLFEE